MVHELKTRFRQGPGTSLMISDLIKIGLGCCFLVSRVFEQLEDQTLTLCVSSGEELYDIFVFS